MSTKELIQLSRALYREHSKIKIAIRVLERYIPINQFSGVTDLKYLELLRRLGGHLDIQSAFVELVREGVKIFAVDVAYAAMHGKVFLDEDGILKISVEATPDDIVNFFDIQSP